MTVLVGIAGRAGAGKSTAAAVLVDGGDFEVVSFAQPLKQMASALLMSGFGRTQWECDYLMENKDIVISELGVSMRYLLQTLGTEWGRNMVSQRMWVNSAGYRIVEQWEHSNVVVDDVRFEDEAAAIRSAGGLLIHLRRPSLVSDDHASEYGVSVGACDVVINNTGSPADLAAEVNRALERFTSGSDWLLRLCLTPCRDYTT